MTYILQASSRPDYLTCPFAVVLRDTDDTHIPLDRSNTDCVKFLEDWAAGEPVTDPAGAAFPYTPENLALLGLEEKETAS